MLHLHRPLSRLLLGIVFMLTTLAFASDPPVILCLGDSLTAGFGVSPGEEYPALLQHRLQEQGFPHRVVNAGLSGDTTGGALRRLNWSLRAKPILAIVVLGANDGFRGLDLEEMQRNLLQIITTLQKAGVHVILGGMKIPPNYGTDYAGRFQAVFSAVAQERSVDLIPFFLEGVAGKPALNQEDGIHPTGAGYRVVLENVWQHLAPRLQMTDQRSISPEK
ncbi:MAG: arylesterase [Magnetococcales bacterium]|nr:arylesterase [Magnetococcales bacterium]MBF0438872.1 arylesterase [Magnetococcales bacterium]